MSLTLQEVSYSVPAMERPILDKVSLTLEPGDFLVILGANGSGKSSLLRCLNGTARPTKGQIRLGSAPMESLSSEEAAQTVSTLGQSLSRSTYGSLTVAENCRIAGADDQKALMKTLAACHPELPGRLDSPAAALSGGQRQCLALALCLLRRPQILLLDEHTSALDPRTAKEVMRVTNAAQERNPSLTLLMTTHSLDDALAYGNRLIMMRQGKCVFEARSEKKRKLTKEDLLTYYE